MSDKVDLTVTAKCPKCDVPVQYDEEQGDAAVVSCPECKDEFGTHGEIRKRALAQAKTHVQKEMRRVLGKAGRGLK